MTIYSIEIPGDEEGMKKFQELMDLLQDEHINEIDTLAKEKGWTRMCASDVLYLRTRSRWTQKLEDELVCLHQAETPPNIFEFGCKI